MSAYYCDSRFWSASTHPEPEDEELGRNVKCHLDGDHGVHVALWQ